MYICVPCRKEMVCDKNGVGADFGNGHVYAGDRFRCSICGHTILATNRSSIQDPDYKTQDEYLDMNGLPEMPKPIEKTNPELTKKLEKFAEEAKSTARLKTRKAADEFFDKMVQIAEFVGVQRTAPPKSMQAEYLGDSVYIDLVPNIEGVVLTTENGMPGDPSNIIFLELSTIDSLTQYIFKHFRRVTIK